MKLRYSLVLATALSLATIGCNKRDQNVETNYNAEKQSAETLIGQINTDMTQMKTDHQQWMTTLDQAAQKPGADTSKINGIKNRMNKHEQDANAVMVLVDSVKQYMNVTTDNNDQLKSANDRLTSNFNDLQSKWKSLQDDHASIKQDVEGLAVTTAGNAVQDTSKANQAARANTTTNKSTTKSSSNPHETSKHSSGGVPKSTGTSSNSSTSTPTSGSNPHQTARHSSGGVPKSTGQ